MILPGVTRDSILALARDHASGKRKLAGLPDKFTVSERNLTMPELVEASRNGTLAEVFGSGTAAIVSSVDGIGYEGELVKVPCGEDGRVSPPLSLLATLETTDTLSPQSVTSPASCSARLSAARPATFPPSGPSPSTPRPERSLALSTAGFSLVEAVSRSRALWSHGRSIAVTLAVCAARAPSRLERRGTSPSRVCLDCSGQRITQEARAALSQLLHLCAAEDCTRDPREPAQRSKHVKGKENRPSRPGMRCSHPLSHLADRGKREE